MKKIKLTVLFLVVFVMYSLLVKSVRAVSPTVSITNLPDYINTNNFKLSYSAISDDPSSITAQFYFKKEGGSYISFGPVFNGASGQVEVTSSQVSEQARYYFKVVINSGSAFDETDTVYDTTPPGPVSDYWKEEMGGGSMYKIHWKNPGDSDFSKVAIYRGEELDFPADGAHKVGEVGGAPNAEMVWENFGLDSNKTYYYVLRAIDKADNSSGLVGDREVKYETVIATPTPGAGGESRVALPEEEKEEVKEEVKGEVLPESTEQLEGLLSPTPKPLNLIGKAVKFAKDRTKITVGIISVILLASYFAYKKLRSLKEK